MIPLPLTCSYSASCPMGICGDFHSGAGGGLTQCDIERGCENRRACIKPGLEGMSIFASRCQLGEPCIVNLGVNHLRTNMWWSCSTAIISHQQLLGCSDQRMETLALVRCPLYYVVKSCSSRHRNAAIDTNSWLVCNIFPS